jgi:hypothetical protein
VIRLPFRTSDDRDYLEPAPSPVVPLSCLLAIVLALGVVDVRLGSRLALIAAAFAAVSLATRLPRVLPVTAVLCLAIAGLVVLAGPGGAPAAAAHAARHARLRTHAAIHAQPRTHPGRHARARGHAHPHPGQGQ